MTPLVSIIVPAKNAAGTLGSLLDDLAGMTLERAEILVVDDGSTDETAAMARARADALPIRVIDGPAVGPAAARNVGGRAAEAPWLAFIDADVRLPEDWLERGLAAATDDVDVVEGVVQRRGGDTDGLVRHWALTDGDGVFVTANLWVRRSSFDKVGGFDEGYPAPWREDTDFGWRLVAQGARTTTASDLVVFHPYYRRPVKSLLHHGSKIVADARLRSKFPEQARQLQPRREMRRGYICTTLLALTAVAALARAPRVTAGLALATEAAASAAVLPMAASRGRTRPREWAELILLAPAICVSRVYWVVRSNVSYRIRFW
ncbi:MAG: hypothetical protein QOG87_749 [Actinomycetota bacterium]|jgi:GT2 family glycosyltransferase